MEDQKRFNKNEFKKTNKFECQYALHLSIERMTSV